MSPTPLVETALEKIPGISLSLWIFHEIPIQWSNQLKFHLLWAFGQDTLATMFTLLRGPK